MNIRISADRGRRAAARTWIFQANPAKYRIEESLQLEQEEYWNLNQHADHIQPGDRVLIWISGQAAGIYALGTVLTPPAVQPDSPQGLTYWQNPAEGSRKKPRVLVRYERVLLDCPLHKVFLEFDPALSKLSIMRSARGTNFPVTEAEWAAIERWLADAPTTAAPASGL